MDDDRQPLNDQTAVGLLRGNRGLAVRLFFLVLAATIVVVELDVGVHLMWPAARSWQFYLLIFLVLAAISLVVTLLLLRRYVALRAQIQHEANRRGELEDQVETLFNQSQDLMCVAWMDPPYFARINPAFEQTLGYPEQQLLARPYMDFVLEEDRQATREALQQLVDGRLVTDFVNRYRHADGSVRWLQWRATPHVDGHRVIATARDITEARAQQQALAESKTRYRLLFENMSDGVAVYDAIDNGRDFVFRDFNPAAERIGRTTRAEVLGRPVTEVFPGILNTGLLGTLHRVWRRGGEIHHPVEYYADSRVAVWTENVVFRLPTNEVVAVFRDVTEAKQAEDRLRDSEQRFRTLFEQAPIGITMVTPQGHLFECNSAFQHMLGYSLEELREGHIAEWTYAEDIEASRQLIARMCRGEARQLTIEKRYVRRNGEVFWAHTAVAVVLDDAGDPAYFISMVEDMSEQHRAQQARETLMGENRELLRRLIGAQEGERAVMARELHDEIGQSLTGLRADVHAIAARCDGEQHPEVQASVAAIEAVASRLHNSASELLHRLRPPLLDELGLRASLEELVKSWQRQHPAVACSSELVVDPSGLSPEAKLALFRVAQEALTNIARHAGAGHVHLETALTHDGRERIDGLRLQVTDDGRGFDPATRRRGMGTASMRERMLMLGGTLQLHSAPGRGVRVSASVPLQPNGNDK